MSLHIDIWQHHNKLYDNKYKDKCDSISGGDNHWNLGQGVQPEYEQKNIIFYHVKVERARNHKQIEEEN